MTKEETNFAIRETEALERIAAALERLQGVEGVEQPLVPPTRSVESRAVPPVLVREALELSMAMLGEAATTKRHDALQASRGAKYSEVLASNEAAEKFERYVGALRSLLPEIGRHPKGDRLHRTVIYSK